MNYEVMKSAAYLREKGWTHISDLGATTNYPAPWLHKAISDYQWWTREQAMVITGIITLREEVGAGPPTLDEIERILLLRDYDPRPEEAI